MADDQLEVLSRQVAAAADAWLTDPRDVGAYTRLVEAVAAWRAFVRPPLPGFDLPGRTVATVSLPASDASIPSGTPPATQPPVPDPPAFGAPAPPPPPPEPESGVTGRPAAALAEQLRGDPRQVLDRLRSGRNG